MVVGLTVVVGRLFLQLLPLVSNKRLISLSLERCSGLFINP